ncbi:MAG: DUF2177 family protein [Rhodospirillales bacterium]
MTLLATYGAMLVVFLGIDAVWLKYVMKPLFDHHVGALLAEEVRLGVAAGFYVLYVMGIIYFAVSPALREGGWSAALLKGALFGFFAYGTYEATNMATLKGWSWTMVAVDVTWGTALTALTALVGYSVHRALT